MKIKKHLACTIELPEHLNQITTWKHWLDWVGHYKRCKPFTKVMSEYSNNILTNVTLLKYAQISHNILKLIIMIFYEKIAAGLYLWEMIDSTNNLPVCDLSCNFIWHGDSVAQPVSKTSIGSSHHGQDITNHILKHSQILWYKDSLSLTYRLQITGTFRLALFKSSHR